MTDPGTDRSIEGSRRGPARHERPVIDALGLEAARHADRALASAVALGVTRWSSYLEPLPERLRDDEPAALRRTSTPSTGCCASSTAREGSGVADITRTG